ncbi:aldo/keto reductase [Vararia minispora EC-137]|uniref:Aldo/keto reductase n=1 Tax=Vararia minispora EC-137 TaxID=1314806 RepID=A0ACB8QLQ4_9AGAM|nr:aldo/keto reductase [Vararia minispora EC-137]
MVQVQTAKLGGTAKDVVIGKVGTGLMLMTWTPTPTPDEQAFAVIKAAIDAMPPGVKMLLNSSQFYAHDYGTANLELLSRFFEKYPEYADKAFLSVKGGTKPFALQPDVTEEGIRTSVKLCADALRGKKKIDLFEMARVDRTRPLEDQLKQLAALSKEGYFDHIGLSESSAKSIREANAVVPIAAVEIEISPWSYEEETRNVIATCAELGIATIAYSPLGRGFLTGTIDKLAPGDMRSHFTRFKEESMKANKVFADALKVIADKKGITSATLCLAWVCSRGPHVVPIPGSSKPERIISNIEAGSIQLTEEDLAAIDKAIKEHEIVGSRYVDGVPKEVLHLWG